MHCRNDQARVLAVSEQQRKPAVREQCAPPAVCEQRALIEVTAVLIPALARQPWDEYVGCAQPVDPFGIALAL